MVENLGLLMHGFSIAFSLENLIAAVSGAVLGLIIGLFRGWEE
ncbi:hypothetical protein [Clostridium sp. AM58-1XD]|nr:hypothetical protein [Clostridium sp. AM58-1XD]